MQWPIPARLTAPAVSSRWLWTGFLSLGLLEVGVYYLLPDGNVRLFLSTAVGFAAVAAIVVGVRVNRPSPALPWYLIAGGTLLFAIGDVVWAIYSLEGEIPFPSIADVAYIAGYPLLAAGGLLLLRPLGRGQRRLASIDAAIIAVGFAVPTWTFLIQPYTGGAATFGDAVLLAYPCADLVLIVLLARLLLSPAWRNPAFWLFVAGAGLMLGADIAYYGIAGAETYYPWLDAAYTLVYVLLGDGRAASLDGATLDGAHAERSPPDAVRGRSHGARGDRRAGDPRPRALGRRRHRRVRVRRGSRARAVRAHSDGDARPGVGACEG